MLYHNINNNNNIIACNLQIVFYPYKYYIINFPGTVQKYLEK